MNMNMNELFHKSHSLYQCSVKWRTRDADLVNTSSQTQWNEARHTCVLDKSYHDSMSVNTGPVTFKAAERINNKRHAAWFRRYVCSPPCFK